MTYFTQTLRKKWGENGFEDTGVSLKVAHEDCMPEDQFETIGPEGHQIRHQKQPWYWAPIYGGMLAVREGRMDYSSPGHLCHFCNKPAA